LPLGDGGLFLVSGFIFLLLIFMLLPVSLCFRPAPDCRSEFSARCKYLSSPVVLFPVAGGLLVRLFAVVKVIPDPPNGYQRLTGMARSGRRRKGGAQ
jgi:hypothetical protein